MNNLPDSEIIRGIFLECCHGAEGDKKHPPLKVQGIKVKATFVTERHIIAFKPKLVKEEIMRKILVSFSGLLLSVLAFCSISSQCLAKEAENVVPIIYDDNLSSVYIEGDPRLIDDPRATITNILSKKGTWESNNPTKRIVAIAITTFGSAGKKANTHTSGLIIHYEIMSPTKK